MNMVVDRAKAAESVLARYFGSDTERLEKCLTLAQHSVWSTLYRLPPPAVALDLAKEVFPSLNNHVEMIYDQPQIGMDATRIPTALIEHGDVKAAQAYLAAAVVSKNPGFELDEERIEGANEMFMQLNGHFHKVLSATYESPLVESQHRADLRSIIEAVQPLVEIGGKFSERALLTPGIARLVYKKNDVELFSEMLANPNFVLPNPGTFAVELDDIWKPAAAGNVSLQKQIISYLDDNIKNLGNINKNKAILAFWKGVPAYLDALDNFGTASDWSLLFKQATTVFNYDALYNAKDLLKTKQLFPMLTNMAKVGQRVQASGVDLSIPELRLALMPLEEVSKIAGRAFAPYMGADYQDMKDALGLLFKDIAPADLSKRPLPKHLASALSDVLDNTKWIGKASLRDRGRILSDDLGL